MESFLIKRKKKKQKNIRNYILIGIVFLLFLFIGLFFYTNYLNKDKITITMDNVLFDEQDNKILIHGDQDYRYTFSVSDNSVLAFTEEEITGQNFENNIIIKKKGFVNVFVQVIEENRIIKSLKKEITVCDNYAKELNIQESYSLNVNDELAIVDENNACLKDVVLTAYDSKVIKNLNNRSIKGLSGGFTSLNIVSGSNVLAAKINVLDDGNDIDITEPSTNIKVDSIEIDKKDITLKVGEEYQLVPTIKPSNATNKDIAFISSNQKVISVDSNGIIKAKEKGEAKVSIITMDGSHTIIVQVSVKENTIGVQNIAFDQDKLEVIVGSTKKLNVIITPNNADNKSLKYTSSNDSVVSVSNTGIIEAKKVGSATITAISYDGASKAKILVNVVKVDVVSVDLNIENAILKVGNTLNLSANISPTEATNKEVSWKSSNEKVATVVDGKVEAKSVGSANIIVTTADGKKQAICRVQVESNVIKVESISLNTTSDQLKINQSLQLQTLILPTDATDKTVTWSSSNPNVATVSDGKVIAKNIGTTTITATTRDGGKIASAKIEVVSNVVYVSSVTMSMHSAEMKIGQTLQLAVNVLPTSATTKTVTWESLNPSVATVSNGQVIAKAQGSAVIKATSSDGTKLYDTCTITVKTNEVSVQSVSLNMSEASIQVGGTLSLIADVNPPGATNKNVDWKSSDETIATVVKGVVTAKKAGDVKITVTTVDGKKTAVANIKVTNVEVESIRLDKTSVDLGLNETITLNADIYPTTATNKELEWKSSNPSVATVSSNGLVTAKGKGSTTITVKTKDGKKSATCKINVIVAVTKISLDNTSLTLEVGKSKTLVVDIKPTDATNKSIKWTTSNDEVATVSNGKVTAVGSGTARITVTTVDGKKSAYCTVTVIVPVTKISLNKTSLTLNAGAYETLTAKVDPTNATDKSVSWKSSNPTVASVTNGVVAALSSGTTTITATSADGKKSATCEVTVIVPVTGVKLSNTSLSLTVGKSKTIKATVEPTGATNQNVSWKSNNPSVATVSNGKITAKKVGTATITVTTEDGSKKATCIVNVTAKIVDVTNVSLSESKLSMVVGDTKTITAKVEPDEATNKEVTWTSSNPKVATVSNGKITAKKTGTTTITVMTTDGNKTATCTVTVVKKMVQIKAATLNVGDLGSCGTSTTSSTCGRSPREFANMFQSYNLNLIGTQEVFNTYNADQLITRSGDLKTGSYYARPNAILSTYSIVSKNNYKLPACGTTNTESRYLQKIVVKINGVNISFYNTHFGLAGCHELHFEYAANILKNDPNPIILVGDFNVSAKSWYTNYFAPLGFKIAAYDNTTHNIHQKAAYCDVIYYLSRDHISLVSKEVIDTYDTYTDHNMVTATFNIY